VVSLVVFLVVLWMSFNGLLVGYEWGLGHFMSGFIGGLLLMIFHFVWVSNENFPCCVIQDGGVMGEF